MAAKRKSSCSVSPPPPLKKLFRSHGLDILDNPSENCGQRFFEWIIHPISVKAFYSEYFEKKPLFIKRDKSSYYDGLFHTSDIQSLLRCSDLVENSASRSDAKDYDGDDDEACDDVRFGNDLDITKYVDGKRQTVHVSGERAEPLKVWKYFNDGCSIRILRPQKYSKTMWQMLSVLDQFFGCMTGVNSYLTPAGTQGFAPHYDDVDVFVLQTEGAKHWKIHGNLNEETTLSRYSSGNFTQEEVGDPVLEVDLHAGDFLYLPRSFIHQANSFPDQHSFHITVSANFRNTWADFLEKSIPVALQSAIEDDVSFRRSLPRNCIEYMGALHSDREDSRRDDFEKNLVELVLKMVRSFPIDSAVDQIAKESMKYQVPPFLLESDVSRSTSSRAEVSITSHSMIRLVSANVARLTIEEDLAVIYHIARNSRGFMTESIGKEEFDIDFAGGLDYILTSFPDFVSVNSIPVDDSDDQISIVQSLYDCGVIEIKR
uniref:Bifunctional lysine-specific demethylase and histidyl-hydroxylase n=2 Tax=Hirondellea gigas TaxID=1518452 RepID=A0A6A7G457_9CRUS